MCGRLAIVEVFHKLDCLLPLKPLHLFERDPLIYIRYFQCPVISSLKLARNVYLVVSLILDY